MHSTITEEAASSYSSSSSSFVLHASAMPSPKKAGRRKFKDTRHPVYRGVRQRNGDKWVCELREPNKKTRLWLGTYPTPEMAARAHDVAAIALRGDSALLNFPDSACALARPVSASPTDIRRAAAKAAALPPVTMTAVADGKPEMFLDEEALFDMPRLLDDMAAGLLLTPPRWKQQHDVDGSIGMDSHMDFSLWGD